MELFELTKPLKGSVRKTNEIASDMDLENDIIV